MDTRFRWLGLLCLSLQLLLEIPSFAEEIDRLLAAVNGKIITKGDVRVAQAIDAVVHLGHSSSAPSEKEEVNRLIDLELVRQDLANFAPTPVEQSSIEEELEKLKQAYAEIGGLNYLLKRLGLQESELRTFITLQVSIQRFINLRFRPFISVAPEEIQRYHEGRLKPELLKAGSPIPPLQEVSAAIEKILVEEKVNDALDAWIRENRRHSRIEMFAGERQAGVPENAP